MTVMLWLPVILFGILGFTTFVAPGFVTRQVAFFLTKLNAVKLERVKRKDLKLFALITRLHAGKRDRFIFKRMVLQIAASISIAGASAAFVLFIAFETTGIIRKLLSLDTGAVKSVLVAFIQLSVSFGVFTLAFGFSVRLLRQLLSIQRKLSNYEEYRRDIIHRWGKDEVANIETEFVK
jgi:hypothetical protein